MNKGNRVVVIRGPHEGNTGTIFWVGQNKRGGERYGVKDDRGETLWLNEDQVEPSDKVAPSLSLPEGAPMPERGTRVKWTDGEGTGHMGEVFWFGEAKGGGKRCGIREDGTGETHWRDAVHVTVTDEGPDPEAVAAAAAAGPMYNKGDEVEVLSGPHRGSRGSVFWIGKDKFGSGQRLGVKVGEESVWIGSAQVKAMGGGGGGGAVGAFPQGPAGDPGHQFAPFDELEESGDPNPFAAAGDEAAPPQWGDEAPSWDVAPVTEDQDEDEDDGRWQ